MATRNDRMLRVPAAVMSAAIMVGLGSGALAQSEAPASPASAGMELPPAGSTIQIGSTLDLAPLDFVDDQGNPTGYELDVVKAVMDDLGYQIEWVKTPFEQAFTGLLSGKYQMNASAI